MPLSGADGAVFAGVVWSSVDAALQVARSGNLKMDRPKVVVIRIDEGRVVGVEAV